MTPTRVILTYRDYEALPADGRRYELHDGEVSVTPAPSPRHQEVSLNLAVLLNHHIRTQTLGRLFYAPIDCILSDTTVVQPDIVYVDSGRLPAISGRGIEGPPTLVIEILSPSTLQIDRGMKFQLYARHGVPYYWIVDPDERSIEAYALTGQGYELKGRLASSESAQLPPFPALLLTPAALWS